MRSNQTQTGTNELMMTGKPNIGTEDTGKQSLTFHKFYWGDFCPGGTLEARKASWTGPAEAKVFWKGPAEAKVSWTGPAEALTLGGARVALTLGGARAPLTLVGALESWTEPAETKMSWAGPAEELESICEEAALEGAGQEQAPEDTYNVIRENSNR